MDINYILVNYGFALPVGKSTPDEAENCNMQIITFYIHTTK